MARLKPSISGANSVSLVIESDRDDSSISISHRLIPRIFSPHYLTQTKFQKPSTPKKILAIITQSAFDKFMDFSAINDLYLVDSFHVGQTETLIS